VVKKYCGLMNYSYLIYKLVNYLSNNPGVHKAEKLESVKELEFSFHIFENKDFMLSLFLNPRITVVLSSHSLKYKSPLEASTKEEVETLLLDHPDGILLQSVVECHPQAWRYVYELVNEKKVFYVVLDKKLQINSFPDPSLFSSKSSSSNLSSSSFAELHNITENIMIYPNRFIPRYALSSEVYSFSYYQYLYLYFIYFFFFFFNMIINYIVSGTISFNPSHVADRNIYEFKEKGAFFLRRGWYEQQFFSSFL
jgi:hypothetical protein